MLNPWITPCVRKPVLNDLLGGESREQKIWPRVDAHLGALLYCVVEMAPVSQIPSLGMDRCMFFLTPAAISDPHHDYTTQGNLHVPQSTGDDACVVALNKNLQG